jgi:HAE1 family hydrophobic/amphiphilic exporter-1
MKNDIAILLVFSSLILFGIFSIANIPVLLLPSYEKKVLSIITEYYGMEPSMIEEIITRPIEIALKEVSGIKNVYSYSSRGKSKILVYLQDKENINNKSVIIKDAISKVSVLFPEECHQPVIYRYNTDDQPLIIFSASSDTMSNEDLFSYLEYRLKQQILSIDGVANVEIYGYAPYEYFLGVPYDSILRSKLDQNEIVNRLVSGSISLPLGNSLTTSSKTYVKFPNKYDNLSDILKLQLPVDLENNKLTNASDIIRLEKTEKENDRISLINNENTMTVLVYKKANSSILQISSGVRKLLKSEHNNFKSLFITDQGMVFSNLLKQLEIAVIISLIIVIVLVSIFFRNKLYLFLISFSIPSSILGMITILYILNKSLNIMSLSGLIIGIGACVDNAIVVIEYMEFYAKQNNTINQIIKNTINSSIKPLIASTLTTIIVFIPFFFIGMDQQILYQDFAISISTVLIISLFYSLLFIPAFIYRYTFGFSFEKIEKILYSKENKSVWFRKNYRTIKGEKIFQLIGKIRLSPILIISSFIILCIVGIFLFVSIYSEDISPMKEKEFTVYFEFNPEFSLDYKYQVMKEIGENLLKKKKDALMYARLEGTLCTIQFQYPIESNTYKKDILHLTDYIKNIKRNDGFFYFEESKKIGEKSLKVYLFGDNLESLNEYVDSIAKDVNHLVGVTSILKGYKKGSTEITFSLKPDEMLFAGLSDSEVIRFLRSCFYYPVVMKHYEKQHLVDVREKIILNDFSLESLKNFYIWESKKKIPIYLSKISSIDYGSNAGMICRKNGKHFISLDIRFAKKDTGKLASEVEKLIKSRKKEIDYYYEFDEEYSQQKSNQNKFIGIILLVVYAIYAVLVIISDSWSTPILILFFVPIIFLGTSIFLNLAGYGISIPVYVSSIVAIGYIVNATILIIEEFNSIKNLSTKRAIKLSYKRKMKSLILSNTTTIGSIIPLFFLSGSSDFFMSLSGSFFFSVFTGTLIPLIVLPFVIIFLSSLKDKLRFNKKL